MSKILKVLIVPLFFVQTCSYSVDSSFSSVDSSFSSMDSCFSPQRRPSGSRAPNSADRKKALASPLQAPIDQLRNLPSALVITDENDVLRDEGEAYAHKLMQAGNVVTSVRFLGTCHDFVMLNALSKTPAARGAIELAISHLNKALHPIITETSL